MDAWLADILIFGTGTVTGGALTFCAGMKIIQRAVDKVIQNIVNHGYFNHKGVRYELTPTDLKGTRH